MALLFGSGLIGAAVAEAMRRTTPGLRTRALAWRWPHPSLQEVQAVEEAARPAGRLAVIWTAGRSGFGTDAAGMAAEHDALSHVIALAERVGGGLPPERRLFVHTSSAGGLFEGQTACGHDARPAPLRPYGAGKAAQERAVLAQDALGHRLILRPSSVYGHAPGGRRGLVSALALSALRRKEAVLFGALTTLRDYVFAPDIGRYVAQRLHAPWSAGGQGARETALLASGQPSSIFEIVSLIEAHFGTPLHIRIDPRPENARNNTFHASALPEGFRPTGLREGLVRTVDAIVRDDRLGVAA